MFHWLPHWLTLSREQTYGLLVFAAIGLLIALAAFTDDAGRLALGLVPDRVAEGEIWRIFTGHIVHLSRMHAFMNELGLLFLIVVLWDVLEPVTLLTGVILSAVAIALGILFAPENYTYYVGFSGVTHGLFAWGGLRVWQSVNRGYGALIIVTVLGKLTWEAIMGPTPGATEAVGGVILVESHLYGVIGGTVAALLWPKYWQRSVPIILAALVFLSPTAPAQAHSIEDSTARVQIDADGDVLVTLDIETAAYILREPPGALSDSARDRLVAMSDAEIEDYINGAGDFMLTTARFLGADGGAVAPEGIRMPTPEALRQHAQTQNDTSTAPQTLLMVFDGEKVRALESPRLRLPAMIGPLFLILNRADGSESIDMLPPGVASQPLDLSAARSVWQEIGSSIVDGILHVVPSGWDHALFMAILVLATPVVRTCLLHATVFTLAHSITLFLAGFGLVNVPGGPVEFGIALTVALAGIDTSLRLRRGATPQSTSGSLRIAVIFAFGLLHGLGFASVFGDLPVSQMSLVTALLGFNIGVELGQIMVIFAVLALLAVLARLGSDRIAARSRFAMSLGIAAVGCLWVAERAGALLV